DRLAIAVPVTPPSCCIEVLQSEPDRIEYLVAVRAHRIRTVQLGPLTRSKGCDGRLVLLIQRRNVGRRRWHMLPAQLLQPPDATLNRARAVGERGCCENARHSQNSPAIAIAQAYFPHLGSPDGLLQAVNSSQGSVEIGIIAIHETDDALVFTHDAFEKQADFI